MYIMTNKLRYTYRIRPGKQAKKRLLQESDNARFIYNQAVAELKNNNEWMNDKTITKLRTENEWLKQGSVVSQQQSLRDFKQSKGKKKFKSRHKTLPSVNYTQRGFSLIEQVNVATGEIKTRLKIAGGYIIPVVWSRKLPSPPTSVRVYQDSVGHWYASFVVSVKKEELPKTDKSIGIDWGVKTIATTTNSNYDLEQPKFSRKAQAQLVRAQRELARRKKGSNHRAHSKKRVAKLHKKVANQRKDLAHKWAFKLVNEFDQIAVEDFKSKFLFKSKMARTVGDNAVGLMKRILCEKGLLAGRRVVLVPPKYTTMDCSVCGLRAKNRLELSVRVFECVFCGVSVDRDYNAACNVLNRAGFNPLTVENVRPVAGSLAQAV